MSSPEYAAPLRLERRVSRRLLAGIALAYGGAAIVPWLLPLDVVLRVSLSLLAIATGLRAGREQCWGSRATVALCWERDGRWRLRRRDGTVETARLLAGSYLQPQLAVLRFALESEVRFPRVRNVVLLPDGVDAESFRRLRVRARLTGNGAD